MLRSATNGQVCVIGAGKMSRLLLKHMAAKGCKSLVLLNRSRPRCEQLAAEFPELEVDIRLMDQLPASVAETDTIFAGVPPRSPDVSRSYMQFVVFLPHAASSSNETSPAMRPWRVCF